MPEEHTDIKKSGIDPILVALIVLGVAIIVAVIWAGSSGSSASGASASTTETSVINPQLSNSISDNSQQSDNSSGDTVGANESSATTQSDSYTPTASADDIYNYISALTYAFSDLYQSTQEITNAQTQYPSLSSQEQVMTASLSVNTDLADASSSLQPYTNDQDEAISSTAKVIYADILLIKQANNTVGQDLETATPETYNPQQTDYDLAQLAAAQSTLQKDLFQNQILYVVLKGIIEVPVNGTPTGPINFSLSASQRQDLEDQIQTTFGTDLANYDNNDYLLAAKLIQVQLSFSTYEEQSAYKLQ